MTETEQKKAAKEFADYWRDKGYEKGQSQSFWLSLLRDVYGVEHPEQFVEFEDQVHLDNTSFIDGMIPSTHVMIEQKGANKDLRKPILQSDGSLLTPFQQAKRYITELPVSKHPKWVITCNFQTFLVYDMDKPGGDPEEIKLEDLPTEYYRLQFLVDTGSTHLERELEVSVKAGEIVGLIYDAFLKQYKDPTDAHNLHSLNVLCVRLVFCLYAENAGIFGRFGIFHDYLAAYSTQKMRKALEDLFNVLDTPEDQRDEFLADDDPLLASFPYVNGGLFSDESITIPPFTEEIRILLLEKASEGFNWSEISPTIFGAVFESTLNPETRRSGGMHYTSVENIHKVIDPLFLDDLKADFKEICDIQTERTKAKKLEDFQKKLASLTFLDPACGSGNFLTESYLSLRRLENDILRELKHGQISLGFEGINPIQVSLNQFYGIEINDFAVTVAKTALWIAESQMMQETESIVMMHLDFLPLKSYTNIVEGNALRMDWNNVVPKERLSYIMGNPPFVGQALRSPAQSEDMVMVFGKGKPETKLDYVICWYKKAIQYMMDTKIVTAFISTNSICQGESVPTFWKQMVADGAEIQFAFTSFLWVNESVNTASVYCVIIGFTAFSSSNPKTLYLETGYKKVSHINGYLISAPDIWLVSRSNKLKTNLPKMIKGSEPTDGGNLFLSKKEKEAFVKEYPNLENCIRPFIGGKEFIDDKIGFYSRYCFWLKNVMPSIYNENREIRERLKAVKELREKSSAERIRKKAEYPYLFCQDRQPEENYLVFPRHSTSNRRYIPIGYMSPNVVVGDACYIIPSLSIYHFGILTSNVHMAWTRTVCGRLGMGYRYSPAIYNNFPWPDPTPEQKSKIEQTAQSILDARALYPDSSLADLYDELTMPPELRKAHQQNDKTVMEAYGFTRGTEAYSSEAACVSELMKLYEGLVNKEQSK